MAQKFSKRSVCTGKGEGGGALHVRRRHFRRGLLRERMKGAVLGDRSPNSPLLFSSSAAGVCSGGPTSLFWCVFHRFAQHRGLNRRLRENIFFLSFVRFSWALNGRPIFGEPSAVRSSMSLTSCVVTQLARVNRASGKAGTNASNRFCTEHR